MLDVRGINGGVKQMSARSMDVVSLRDSIVGEYRKFATSVTTIRAADIRDNAQGCFWPDDGGGDRGE
jgi:hypothetical protein